MSVVHVSISTTPLHHTSLHLSTVVSTVHSSSVTSPHTVCHRSIYHYQRSLACSWTAVPQYTLHSITLPDTRHPIPNTRLRHHECIERHIHYQYEMYVECQVTALC